MSNHRYCCCSDVDPPDNDDCNRGCGFWTCNSVNSPRCDKAPARGTNIYHCTTAVLADPPTITAEHWFQHAVNARQDGCIECHKCFGNDCNDCSSYDWCGTRQSSRPGCDGGGSCETTSHLEPCRDALMSKCCRNSQGNAPYFYYGDPDCLVVNISLGNNFQEVAYDGDNTFCMWVDTQDTTISMSSIDSGNTGPNCTDFHNATKFVCGSTCTGDWHLGSNANPVFDGHFLSFKVRYQLWYYLTHTAGNPMRKYAGLHLTTRIIEDGQGRAMDWPDTELGSIQLPGGTITYPNLVVSNGSSFQNNVASRFDATGTGSCHCGSTSELATYVNKLSTLDPNLYPGFPTGNVTVGSMSMPQCYGGNKYDTSAHVGCFNCCEDSPSYCDDPNMDDRTCTPSGAGYCTDKSACANTCFFKHGTARWFTRDAITNTVVSWS